MGVDTSLVIPYTEAPEVKSVGRNYCLPKNEYDKRVVLQNLFELCEEVGIKLRRLSKKARTIGVSLRGDINVGGRQTYSSYMDRGSEIFRACLNIIRDTPIFTLTPALSPQGRGRSDNSLSPLWERVRVRVNFVRQISVWVLNLENKENIQQSLFDSAKPGTVQNLAKPNSLQEAIDKINDRFGDHTIRNGFLLYADKLTTVPNGYMADKYELTQLAKD